MRAFYTCLGGCLLLPVMAQGTARYDELVREAFSLYEKKEFAASAARYSAAFASLGWKGHANDRYNAACSWALAGQTDSAFFNLFRIAERMDYANVAHITTDSDLTSLHVDARWSTLLDLVKANKERIEAHFDWALVSRLDSIFEEDQGLRQRSADVEQQYGSGSPEMKAHWRRIMEKDSLNLIAVARILDERGWLGPDVVGEKGNQTIFLVVQHADIATQERYLPLMRAAVAKGNAKSASLALLEDRVLMRRGRKQLYGSQIGRDPESGAYFLSPLEDPDHVDERRAAMGLGPIADYLLNWDMHWDVDAYKKELPLLEERLKAQER